MMFTGIPLKPSGDLIQVIGLLVADFGGLLGFLVGVGGGSFGWSSCKYNLLGNIGTERDNSLIELFSDLSYKSFSLINQS